MTPCPPDDVLARLLADQLPGAEHDLVAAHTSSCPGCLERMARQVESVPGPWYSSPACPWPRTSIPESYLEKLKACPPGSRQTATQSYEPEPPSFAPGTALGDEFRIVSFLGRGGMGEVYLGEQVRLKRRVAIKVVSPACARLTGALKRFEKELETLAQVPPDPHVATAFAAGEFQDRPYLVMEFLDGTDLSRYLKERGRLDVAEACGHVRQAALGLGHLHDHGIVHRDVKPSNLFLTRGGTVKILDLGLARLVDTKIVSEDGSLTPSGAIVGTLDYLAPEQARGAHAADRRSDLYGLGCTFYCLLTGHAPFHDRESLDKVVGHASHTPTPVTSLQPEVPPPLAAVVHRLLAKNPQERFASAQEFVGALDSALLAPPPPASKKAPRLIVVTATLLTLLIGGALAIRGWPARTQQAPVRTKERSEVLTGYLGGRRLEQAFALEARILNARSGSPSEGYVLHDGDRFRLEIKVPRDVYLEIWFLQENGQPIQFLPNAHQTDNHLSEGKHVIPSADAKYDFRVSKSQGAEYVYLIASTARLPLIPGGDPRDTFRILRTPEQKKQWQQTRGGEIVERPAASVEVAETILEIERILPRN